MSETSESQPSNVQLYLLQQKMIHYSPFTDDFVRVPPAAENPKHDPGADHEDEAQDGDEYDDHQGLGGQARSHWGKD